MKPDDIMVYLAVFALSVMAVIYAPVTGFWWNFIIFLGAFEVAKFVVAFLVVLLYKLLGIRTPNAK